MKNGNFNKYTRIYVNNQDRVSCISM